MDELQGFDIDTCAAAAGLPGIGTLEYAGLDEVDLDSWEPAVDTGHVFRRTLSATWHELPFVVGTGALSEEQDDDAQGPTYRLQLSVLLPGDNTDIRAELNRMKQRRFLVRMTGRDARPLLIGTPEQPLGFESRFETGPQGGDQRAHRCRFTGVALHKIPEYIPTW